jgi:hypothetical protein
VKRPRKGGKKREMVESYEGSLQGYKASEIRPADAGISRYRIQEFLPYQR